MIYIPASTEPTKPSSPKDATSLLSAALASNLVILLEVQEGTPQEIVDQAVDLVIVRHPGQEIAVVYVEDK